jgi:hypothetical protein
MTVSRVRHSSNGLLIGILILAVLVQGLFLDHFTGNYFWLFMGLCDGACRQIRHQALAQPKSSYRSPPDCINPVAA